MLTDIFSIAFTKIISLHDVIHFKIRNITISQPRKSDHWNW